MAAGAERPVGDALYEMLCLAGEEELAVDPDRAGGLLGSARQRIDDARRIDRHVIAFQGAHLGGSGHSWLGGRSGIGELRGGE